MTCHYRIVLTLDGGADALLVPIVGLSALCNRINTVDVEQSLIHWTDLIVASGDSVLLAALLAQNNLTLSNELEILKQLMPHQNNGYNPEMVNALFKETDTLQTLRKHYMFMTYDVDMDELFSFSDNRPTQQSLKLSPVLKACMGNPNEQQFVKLGYRRLMNASTFVPNPVVQAVYYANCLYQDDSVVLVSIGSGKHAGNSLEEEFVRTAENEVLNELKNHRKWHYFRFNPEFEAEDDLTTKIAKTRAYFEREAPTMDRLFHLLEIKSGKLI